MAIHLPPDRLSSAQLVQRFSALQKTELLKIASNSSSRLESCEEDPSALDGGIWDCTGYYRACARAFIDPLPPNSHEEELHASPSEVLEAIGDGPSVLEDVEVTQYTALRALQGLIGSNQFDSLFQYDTELPFLESGMSLFFSIPLNSPNSAHPGDILQYRNIKLYDCKHPLGSWDRVHVLCTRSGKFPSVVGWKLPPREVHPIEIESLLRQEFNRPPEEPAHFPEDLWESACLIQQQSLRALPFVPPDRRSFLQGLARSPIPSEVFKRLPPNAPHFLPGKLIASALRPNPSALRRLVQGKSFRSLMSRIVLPIIR